MKRKKISYNEINDEVYYPEEFSKVKIFFLCSLLFFIGFIINVNLSERLNKIVKPLLASNPNCPINFEKLDFEYILPKIIFKNPVIQGLCFGHPGNAMPLSHLSIAIDGPSFVPPGIKIKIEAIQGKTHLEIFPSISFGSKIIEIRNSTINASDLGALFADGISPFTGKIDIDGVLHFSVTKITEGAMNIKSKNFVVPEQNIKGFMAPTLNLNHLSIKLRVAKDSNMDIREFKLGTGDPLGLELKGKIFLNYQSFMNSQVDLDGNLATTPFFLESFAILKLMLPEPQNPQGKFKIKLSGELASMNQPQITNP